MQVSFIYTSQSCNIFHLQGFLLISLSIHLDFLCWSAMLIALKSKDCNDCGTRNHTQTWIYISSSQKKYIFEALTFTLAMLCVFVSHSNASCTGMQCKNTDLNFDSNLKMLPPIILSSIVITLAWGDSSTYCHNLSSHSNEHFGVSE